MTSIFHLKKQNLDPYPGFIHLSVRPSGNITVTVMSPPNGESPGFPSHINLTPEEFDKLAEAIEEYKLSQIQNVKREQ